MQSINTPRFQDFRATLVVSTMSGSVAEMRLTIGYAGYVGSAGILGTDQSAQRSYRLDKHLQRLWE
jgi:hypothetical protein